MNIARPYDGLLSAEQTLVLMSMLRHRTDGVPQELLIRDLAASIPISWSRARNTILKLSVYGIITASNEQLVWTATDAANDSRVLVADRVASDLIDRLIEKNAWSCAQLNPQTGAIMIDTMTLPPMIDGLGMWITEFGIAVRDRIEARHWVIAEQYRRRFLSGVRRMNAVRPRRSISAEKLAAQLARQAENGKAAEEWVLQYERQRLKDHPLSDQIRIVSEADVAAGYDIASFAGQLSLQYDRFIEVKSYSTKKLFHWSRNEIATAEEFGEQYSLYLVDRSRMSLPDYRPQIISAPSPEIFTQLGSGWKVEATSFEHVWLEG